MCVAQLRSLLEETNCLKSLTLTDTNSGKRSQTVKQYSKSQEDMARGQRLVATSSRIRGKLSPTVFPVC